MFRHIFNGLEQRFAKELAVIRTQYPSEPVRFTDEPLIIHWWDAIKMLREHGHEVIRLFFMLFFQYDIHCGNHRPEIMMISVQVRN